MPRPRNDSEASVRMVEPSCAVASTISGASVFGSTWRSAMRVSLMPIDLAASTNGSSRSASVLARMTRATVGISGIAIAMITFGKRRPQRCRHHQRQHQQRQRLQNIGDALEHQVDPAGQITRCETDDHADRRAQRGRADADGERNARAVDDPAPDIAAERIRAHPVQGIGDARRCAESTLSGSKRQIRSADIATQTNITMMKRPMVPSM